mmetsp:Transcript_12908/g.20890  ORF Transcript_12908/g.20890 Transcript_12908/m.20890 type:complete len:98 (-) Transcript_12908:309-602(-)
MHGYMATCKLQCLLNLEVCLAINCLLGVMCRHMLCGVTSHDCHDIKECSSLGVLEHAKNERALDDPCGVYTAHSDNSDCIFQSQRRRCRSVVVRLNT